MASFVMLKMAKENQENNPNAATVLSRDRYMDDLIHSCPTPKKAVDTIKELDRVLDTGSFKIKEWLSSSKDALKKLTHESVMESCQEIPDVKTNSDSPVNLDGDKGVKPLGVGWNPQADVLSFPVKETEIQWKFTTPHSPHQGGIYESLTKQTKRSLRVAIGSQVLSWNEMSTVFEKWSHLLTAGHLVICQVIQTMPSR